MAETVDVAVIGAAGGTGQSAVRALAAAGLSVRPLIHRAEQASLFDDPASCRVVELADMDGVSDALRGALAVHYIPPVYNTREELFGRNVVQAAENAGVDRLVYHSVLHAPTPAMVHHWRKAKVELIIRESALRWTIIQPAMYFQTIFAFWDQATLTLEPGFSIDRLFTPIDLGDISAALVQIISHEGHDYATYELAGPDRMSFKDFGACMSSALGRDVTVRSIPPSVVDERAKALGYSEGALEELRMMLAHYDAHGLIGNANVLRMLLGRDPTGFRQVLENRCKQ